MTIDTEPEVDYDALADQILAKTRAPLKSKARGPKPRKVPQKRHERALHKRTLRQVIHDAVGEVSGGVHDDEVNVITNRIWKRAARPAMARAFAEGVEIGRDDVAQCCGCSGSNVDITNPYDGSTL